MVKAPTPDEEDRRHLCRERFLAFVTRYPNASDISLPPSLLGLLPAGANREVGVASTGNRRLVTARALT